MCKHDDGCNVPEGECSGACLVSVDSLQSELQQLRATNAAQAEQLAAQAARIAELEASESRLHDVAVHCANVELELALLQSIPPEPQAGVELTDEEIKAAFIEAHGGDAAYYESHGYEIRWTTCTVQRALNQRQAVKTEPAIQALAMIGEVLGLDEDDAGPTPIIEKIVCLQEAFETVKRLHLIATNQVVDLRKAAKPVPLSAAQGVPEIIGTVVSVDVSTGDENFGDRIYGRVFAIQDDVLLVEETGRNFKPEPLSAAHGVPEYNWFVGKAGDEYIQSVAYKGQHTLPVQFRWNDLFNVLLKAALSAAPEQAESKEATR